MQLAKFVAKVKKEKNNFTVNEQLKYLSIMDVFLRGCVRFRFHAVTEKRLRNTHQGVKTFMPAAAPKTVLVILVLNL